MAWEEYLKSHPTNKEICVINPHHTLLTCKSTASDLEITHFLMEAYIYIRQRNAAIDQLRHQVIEYEEQFYKAPDYAHFSTYQDAKGKLERIGGEWFDNKKDMELIKVEIQRRTE